jgi:hypothetical protein
LSGAIFSLEAFFAEVLFESSYPSGLEEFSATTFDLTFLFRLKRQRLQPDNL